ncbi:MAG TPA: PhzF family phenazine biosynthesis protein [Devosia sp.]|jgi:trans-2,3-dihydro-3-hydroxyanthranilate isomerase|nr:PhzF family phenazine biosynthesis protein [Devosia sp.]
MKLDYLLLDVFTRDRLQGNPLAVVMRADGLLDDQMQRIASEFNLSETVFITRPKTERHTAAVRIFTPQVELPFAGHPTVGAAVVLGLEGKSSAVRIEETIGIITCVIEKLDKRSGHARFALPHLPMVAGKPPEKRQLALTLGLEPEEIGFGLHQPSVYSAGVIFYLVPVRGPDVLRRVTPERRGWPEVFPLGHNSVYVYTETPNEEGNDFAARMFSPGMGLGEDPATGAAAAALIGELAGDAGDGQTEYIIRQGVEMGRPSLISIQIRKSGETLTHGGIGGNAVIIGQGTLDLDA